MHYLIKNPCPSQRLHLPPGTAREVSHEEMSKIADVVARALSPVAQRLVNTNDEHGQGASRAETGPSNGPRVHCYLVDEGKEQELSAKDLLEIYADDIKARAAAKKDAYAKRLVEKRAGR